MRRLQFRSHVWTDLGVSISLTFGYHPQTKGQLERANQELGQFLHSYCSDNQEDWAKFLPWANYTKNSLRHSLPMHLGLPTISLPLGCQSHIGFSIWWVVLQKQTGIGTNPSETSRDQVWLATPDLWNTSGCHKFNPKYVGPYKITKWVSEVHYELALSQHSCIHPKFHVSCLFCFI